MTHPGTTDVLIAGAGPVGLSAAAELRRQGVITLCRAASEPPSQTAGLGQGCNTAGQEGLSVGADVAIHTERGFDPERARRQGTGRRTDGRLGHGLERCRPDAQRLQPNTGNPGGSVPESPDGRLLGDPCPVMGPAEREEPAQVELVPCCPRPRLGFHQPLPRWATPLTVRKSVKTH
ncbi:FAD-dependent monooxygenase [Streptomyces sp. NPDC060002]|uniref:FAD-dependent monooxygenase n=1 Tax=Streptomyces sp. NPDC060002 TaxID=3347033 RepID=UPI0036B9A4B0